MQSRELPYGLVVACIGLCIVLALILSQPLLALLAPFIILLLHISGKPSLIFYALCLSIPFSAEVQVTPSLGTDLPDEPLMWLATVATGFLMYHQRQPLARLLSHPVIILILLSWCWSWISMLRSADPLLSLKFILAKTWYLIPFVFGSLLLLNTVKRLRVAVICIVVPMLLLAVSSLARHAITGFDFREVSNVVWPFFRNHVNYGALLVCCIPPVYILYRRNGNGWWLFSLFILLLAVYFSYSRGAWLALVAGAVVWWAVRRQVAGWVIALSLVAVTAGTVFLLDNQRYLQFRPDYENTIYHGQLAEHIEATYAMRDLSTAERFYRWIAGWRMGTDHLLTGVGPNHFYPAYRSYTVESFRTYVSDNPERSTVHNYFLLLLAEQGLPGMLLFMFTLIAMLMTAQRVYANGDQRTQQVALVTASIVAMITVLICLSDLIETDKIGSVFYICAGVLVAAASGSYIERIPEPVAEKVE